jgi:NADH-quinone oxidoreductase subunit J
MLIILIILFNIVFFSSIGVINTNNPVHSVFFLILTFSSGSLFFFFLYNEFIAIIIIILYIGAIIVLFLFVIMMLDIKLIELRMSNYLGYYPLISLCIIIFFFEVYMSFNLYDIVIISKEKVYIYWLNMYIYKLTNIHIIGLYLYTYYFLLFILCAVLLFSSTIGVILLAYMSFSTRFKRFNSISQQYFVNYKLNVFSFF